MTELIRTVAALGAMLLLGCGGSGAPADDAHDANAQTGSPVDGTRAPEAELRELTPLAAGAPLGERTERARQIGDRLRVRSDRVQRWLRDARRAQYGKQTACLDDLLSQLHAAEREGLQAQKAARAAASHEDERAVDRELSRLVVFEERSRLLVHMARSCGRVRPASPQERALLSK